MKEQVSFNRGKSMLTERERSTLDVIDFVINFDNGKATFIVLNIRLIKTAASMR